MKNTAFREKRLKRVAGAGFAMALSAALACPPVALADEPAACDADVNQGATSSVLSVREEGDCGADVAWTASWDGVLTISGSGPIEEIPSEWFELRNDIVSIVIEEGVTSIPDSATAGAFFSFKKLKEVKLPSTLEHIGDSAFWDCESLESIDLPKGLSTIGESAFESTGLASIVIPGNVTSIGQGCFKDCSSLSTAVIEKGVRDVPSEAFEDCSSLGDVSIADSVESIGERAFYSCDALKTVEIPGSCKQVGPRAFAFCSSLKEVSLGKGVESVEDGAFQKSAIESITLPESLESIADAFSGCDALGSVEFQGAVPEGVADTLGFYSGKIIYPADESSWSENVLAELPRNAQFFERNADGSLSEVNFYAPVANERIPLREGEPESYTFSKTPMSVSFDFTLESASTVSFTLTHLMSRCVHEMMMVDVVDSTGQTVVDFGVLNYQSPSGITRTAALPAGEYHWEISFMDSHHDSPFSTVSVSYWIKGTNGPDEPSEPVSFNDINGHWAKDVIEEAATEGLINGYEDGSFKPDAKITRGQLATILFRASGDTAPVYAYSGYLDVPNGEWYTDAIVWASREGIVSGYNETQFGPEDYVTREQACKMIALYSKTRGFDVEGASASELERFSDRSAVSSWAVPYVAWTIKVEIIGGYSENGQSLVKPSGTATRAEMAKIIVGALKLDPSEQEGFRYQEGEYVVGKDIPAGEYAFFGTSDKWGGYACVYETAEKGRIVENEIFDTTYYMTVTEGQLLLVERGEFIPAEKVSAKLETSIGTSEEIVGNRMYKVGVDIPAGTYRLTADGSGYDGYYCVYSSSKLPLDIAENDLFDANAYVTVKAGQYLSINNCNGVKE